jgi:diacylglycerol kinase family enzyme
VRAIERALLIVNPRAHRVTPVLAERVAARLATAFKLDVARTLHRGHAVELAREAVGDGTDAVVTFSGDGTVNEAANALAGSDVALGILPGGATNVLCRHLGYPPTLPAATAELAGRARAGRTREIRLASANGRRFTVAAGAGIDAATFERVERHPELKRRFGPTYMFAALFETLWRDFIDGDPVRFRVRVDGAEPFEAIFAVACHLDPGTFYQGLGVHLAPRARLGESTDLTSFVRIPPLEIPRLIWSMFVTGRHVTYPYVRYSHDVREVAIEADRPFPVHVDGDVLGRTTRLDLRVTGERLRLIA